jgi:hypothetical protein
MPIRRKPGKAYEHRGCEPLVDNARSLKKEGLLNTDEGHQDDPGGHLTLSVKGEKKYQS